MKANDTVGFAFRGAKGGWIPNDPIRIAVFWMLAIAILFVSDPANAQLFDGLVEVLDEATVTFEDVVATFILLFGLVAAWIIGGVSKNIGLGVACAVAVLAFAAMVARNEEIAGALGFG